MNRYYISVKNTFCLDEKALRNTECISADYESCYCVMKNTFKCDDCL